MFGRSTIESLSLHQARRYAAARPGIKHECEEERKLALVRHHGHGIVITGVMYLGPHDVDGETSTAPLVRPLALPVVRRVCK